MHRFLMFNNGRQATSATLRNAYMLGADGSAMRADIAFEDGEIRCQKRETGLAALALQQRVGDCGELTLQTCLLPERGDPYLLLLELARHQLMLLYTKQEEWGMFDIGPDHPATKRADLARRLFVEALCHQHDDPAKADRLAHDALIAAIDGGEELALAHAELLLTRRKAAGMLPTHPVGCGVRLSETNERLRAALPLNFDYVNLPTPWRLLAPESTDYDWTAMDNWAEWAGRQQMSVLAGPVVSFQPQVLPNWLYIWEHDYETIRDLIYEHVERVVTRYRNSVTAWTVVSGLHVNSHFTFNFEQLMDLTRMATMQVKKIQPAAKALIEIQQPFGEYYGANQRSIPPMMYADLVIQGAINFDAFSLKLMMGQAMSGQYARDLLQISQLLDQFANFGKPVYLTLAVPSETVTQAMLASPDAGTPVDPNCGHWRKPWSQLVQSHWLEAVCQIALSKPFVEAVTWCELTDHPDIELPMSGLLGEDLQPKGAFRRLLAFRKNMLDTASRVAVSADAGTEQMTQSPE